MKKTLYPLAVGALLTMGCSSTQLSSAAPTAKKPLPRSKPRSKPLGPLSYPSAAPQGRKIDFALLNAADVGNTAQVKKLLAQGANVNATNADIRGRTALIFASWKGRKETVRFLLDKGANWKIKDKWGRTAVMLAIAGGHVTVTEMLRAKGAEINGRD